MQTETTSKYQNLFHFDAREREKGDDLGVLAFAIGWIVAIVTLFTGDAGLLDLMNAYIYLDFGCALWIILHLYHSKDKKLDAPSNWLAVRMFMGVTMSMLALFLISVFLSVFQANIDMGLAINYVVFEYARVIASEELVFRGLIIDLFLIAHYMLKNKDSFTTSIQGIHDDTKESKFVFLVASIVSSILFGILHFKTYPGQWLSLIYLGCLGMFLCLMRYKWGLFPAILLHALNNIIASAMI